MATLRRIMDLSFGIGRRSRPQKCNYTSPPPPAPPPRESPSFRFDVPGAPGATGKLLPRPDVKLRAHIRYHHPRKPKADDPAVRSVSNRKNCDTPLLEGH